MKYIITGGAGFIGSHIAESLASNHEVVVIDNLFSGKIENINNLPIIFENRSITDLAFLKRIFEGADGVFHQAAITSVPRSVKDPLPTNEANITGTLNVLVAAKEMNVRKVVFASSSSVYGDTPVLPKTESMTPNPLSPYGISKLTGEQYCRVFSELYGLKTVALRYFNVFGPRQDPKSEYSAVIPKFITRILKHESPTIYGDGEQTRDFTYVKDVVQANIRAMESDVQGIFNVAYCQRITLNSLASFIMEITGNTVPVLYDPPRPGDIRDSLADIGRIQNELKYKPGYTVKTGLEETITWYQNQ
ncbi:SDR family oxidoreductase [Methanospirillum stamsii]|uniref:GDP-mannose 4,6-dehydratase n=1 Tax=Methanospirillum stamsii TaxID=1277351 RepID=A0A2V2MWL5_9EURY|nr:SDR family oxidoreductase [Methanospirillum stamsii]PWR71779.1 GDP-mannose 4,6-dehydratase [Methanospirillum stamsii]